MARGEWTDDWHWVACIDGSVVDRGTRLSLAEAYVSAWIAVAVAPPPVELDRAEVAEIAEAVEDRGGRARDLADALRRLLMLRTGIGWSVVVGRGRQRYSVRVAPLRVRLVDGAASAADRVLLAAIFGGRPGRDGIVVKPNRGHRAAAVWAAAGLELPEDLELAHASELE